MFSYERVDGPPVNNVLKIKEIDLDISVFLSFLPTLFYLCCNKTNTSICVVIKQTRLICLIGLKIV